MAEVKSADVAPVHQQQGLRRRSLGSVELQDAQGRRRTVDLNELTEADRELAAKFGYKPVCEPPVAKIKR